MKTWEAFHRTHKTMQQLIASFPDVPSIRFVEDRGQIAVFQIIEGAQNYVGLFDYGQAEVISFLLNKVVPEPTPEASC